MLVFTLAARQASQRVEVWRKLRRSGALPLRSSGYVLPKTPANEERFQWLAADIRKHKGEASVIEVTAIDDLPAPTLVRLFVDARAKEYDEIAKELQKQLKRRTRPGGTIARLRRRFQEVVDRDFFSPPARSRVEQLLERAEAPEQAPAASTGRRSRKAFFGRQWLTRPRPGIDRVSSAWLIRRFIDANATFAFAHDSAAHAQAVPFDMFGGAGFGHRGDLCTFETLVEEFAIRDARVTSIAQAVHDADLADEKFGRAEALGIERVLVGWANQGISDDELLRRGMEMVEGWYQSM